MDVAAIVLPNTDLFYQLFSLLWRTVLSAPSPSCHHLSTQSNIDSLSISIQENSKHDFSCLLDCLECTLVVSAVPVYTYITMSLLHYIYIITLLQHLSYNNLVNVLHCNYILSPYIYVATFVTLHLHFTLYLHCHVPLTLAHRYITFTLSLLHLRSYVVITIMYPNIIVVVVVVVGGVRR